MPEYRRNSKDYKPYTVFAFAQPGAAWVGLIGCFLVFAFTSATWWNSKVTFSKVAVAYAAVSPLSLILGEAKLILPVSPASDPPSLMDPFQNHQQTVVDQDRQRYRRAVRNTPEVEVVQT